MKYTIFVAYSLKGNDYTERPNLECAYTFGPLCHYDIYIQEVE